MLKLWTYWRLLAVVAVVTVGAMAAFGTEPMLRGALGAIAFSYLVDLIRLWRDHA